MKFRHLALGRAVFILGLLAVSGLARAQAPGPRDAWRAASPEDRRKAEALFAEGSRLFKQWRFAEAEAKYRMALSHWKHPVIYLYLSRVLEKQGDLTGAYQILQQATGPFSPTDFRAAEALHTRLDSQLGQIEAHCAEPGAEILLDGEPWFTAPGWRRRMISPGQHVVVARKEGYFTVTEAVALVPGKQTQIAIRMNVEEVRIERRWKPWNRWILGGGVATSLIGGLFLWQARNDYKDFTEALSDCPRPSCPPIPAVSTWKETFGTSALLVGGAAAAVVFTSVLLNQPRVHPGEPSSVNIQLVPLASGDATGISARIRF